MWPTSPVRDLGLQPLARPHHDLGGVADPRRDHRVGRDLPPPGRLRRRRGPHLPGRGVDVEAEAGAGVVTVGAEQPFGRVPLLVREVQVAGAQHVEELELAQLVRARPDPFQLVVQPVPVVDRRRGGLQERADPGQHGPAAQRVGTAQEPRPDQLLQLPQPAVPDERACELGVGLPLAAPHEPHGPAGAERTEALEQRGGDLRLGVRGRRGRERRLSGAGRREDVGHAAGSSVARLRRARHPLPQPPVLVVAEAGRGHGRRRCDGHDGVTDPAHGRVVAELAHRPLRHGPRLVGHRQHRDRAALSGGVQQVEQRQVLGPPVVQEQDDGVRHRRVTG